LRYDDIKAAMLDMDAAYHDANDHLGLVLRTVIVDREFWPADG
jgi:hypothetical protein